MLSLSRCIKRLFCRRKKKSALTLIYMILPAHSTQSSMVQPLVTLSCVHCTSSRHKAGPHFHQPSCPTLFTNSIQMLCHPKEPEFTLAARPRKPAFQNCHFLKASLKGAAASSQQTARSCVKLCILCLEFIFKILPM